jgi:hypothetical protein
MNNQFEKVKLTYKILMELMGLSEVYDRIMEDYNLKRNYQLKHILIKICYRCILAERTLHKLEKIFKLIKKKNELLSFFIKHQN